MSSDVSRRRRCLDEIATVPIPVRSMDEEVAAYEASRPPEHQPLSVADLVTRVLSHSLEFASPAGLWDDGALVWGLWTRGVVPARGQGSSAVDDDLVVRRDLVHHGRDAFAAEWALQLALVRSAR